MSATLIHRDEMARHYADGHLATDPGIQAVYYLPSRSPAGEIRLIEVNSLRPERPGDELEPLDCGVHIGAPAETPRLLVLDVSPQQWERVLSQSLALPSEWTLEGAMLFARVPAAA